MFQIIESLSKQIQPNKPQYQISQNLQNQAYLESLKSFLSENNSTIFQNTPNLQQAYIFCDTPKVQEINDQIQISSQLIINISDFLYQAKSKIKIISNSPEKLDDFLEDFVGHRNFTMQRKDNIKFKGFETQYYGFYHRPQISWPINQIEQLIYSDEYNIQLDFQATTDTDILIPTFDKYFSKKQLKIPQILKPKTQK